MTNVVHLKAPDISCGHCVQSVKNRLDGVEGVEHVDASAETKIVDVTFDSSKVSLDKIQSELADEGYPATQI